MFRNYPAHTLSSGQIINRCRKQTLLEAAAIAAWFSKAAASFPQYRQETAPTGNFQKVAVDYCPVGHVRKPGRLSPGNGGI
ncbi:MAG: hypothetical protein ACOX1A_03670 [Saccharofermentanales bacterium]